MAVTRVLLVDDDVELAELVGEYLTREGFTLDAETDGTHALDRAVSGDYQLTVLDVMLPGISGFDLLRGIRATSQMPVLMLTARGDDVDRIVGLELGADDYLSKPFNPRELVARIRAILRRTQTEARTPGERAAETLGVDDVAMDLGSAHRPESRGAGRADRGGVHAPRAAAARGRRRGPARRARPRALWAARCFPSTGASTST